MSVRLGKERRVESSGAKVQQLVMEAIPKSRSDAVVMSSNAEEYSVIFAAALCSPKTLEMPDCRHLEFSIIDVLIGQTSRWGSEYRTT